MGTSKPADSMSPRIQWYRTAIPRDELRKLTARSDLRAMLYTGSYLGLIAATGTALVLLTGRSPWWVILILLAVHGTIFSFMINGFHELSHGTVFKSKMANEVFLRIFSFLGWYSHAEFRASHTRHHASTLHPPDDMEVVLPIKLTALDFVLRRFVDPIGFAHTVRVNLRNAFGRLRTPWVQHIFAQGQKRPGGPVDLKIHIRWAWILLLGHGAIVAVAAVTGLWMLPVVITLGRYYGTALHFLCNSAQHIGLSDNVDDFRLCCRTIELNPVVRFLYWQMNYHTEHHMYAAVPCYNLRKLHHAVRHDLPPTVHGLRKTWKQIIGILKRQKTEPGYEYVPELPASQASTG